MSYPAVDDAHELIRGEVLSLTSDFRNGLERLSENDTDTTGPDGVIGTSRSLAGATARSGIAALIRWSEALDRLAVLGAFLARGTAPAARQIWIGLIDTLGVFEQSLDACFEGASAPRLARFDAALLRAIPEAWRAYAELDPQTFARRLRDLAPPRTSVATTDEVPAADDADAAFQRELLAAFTTEVTECFERSETLLVRLERQQHDPETLNALFREFHTLKGAAAAVELPAAAEQLHEGESLLQALRDDELVVDSGALVDFLLRLADSVRGLIDQACGRSPSSPIISDVVAEIAQLKQVQIAPVSPAAAALPVVPTDLTPAERPTPPAADPLQALADLRRKVARGEIDPQLLQVIDALDQRARHFSQIAATLQDEVNSLRTVPLEGILRRLQRPARDAARLEGKCVEIEIAGGGLRVERSTAERLSGPLLHLVRNAVAHGIEPPLVREACGKARVGCIRVCAEQRDNDLIVTIADDGGGLDFEAIRAKAIARRWVDPSQPAARDELARLIFRPGFSTRDDVTDLAGRGVGMDVVAREIEALHGRAEVDSRDGHGTTVRLIVPMPVATRMEAAE